MTDTTQPPAGEDWQSPADDAFDRMKRAHSRGTGCTLTAEMIRALSVTIVGDIWHSPRVDKDTVL